MHRMETSIGERFRKDCLDAILAKRSHQRMCGGDFPKSVYSVDLLDRALAHKPGEPPGLTAIFSELCIRNRSPCFADFAFFIGDHDVATLERDFAQAI